MQTGRFLVVEIKRYLKKFDEAKEELDRLAKILEEKLRMYRDIHDKEMLLIENKDIYVRSFLLSEVVKNDLKNIRM